MSDNELQARGEIPLHDRYAIGLQLATGRIGLYPIGSEGWMVGIALNVDMRHYRKEGASTGNMVLESLELTIGSSTGNYIGRIEGWEHFATEGSTWKYKPDECQLLPHHPEFTTFAWLDAWEEPDPWFYYGWGFRTDLLHHIGYRKWNTVAYLGVNYPIDKGACPTWVEVPEQEELYGLLKPGAPNGQWKVKARISGFTVDPEVPHATYIALHVHEGRRPFYKGALDFVKSNDRIVGEDDVDWTGVYWGSLMDPGQLTMLSGAAKGVTFRVINTFFIGDSPPTGYPPNTWCIRTHPSDPLPAAVGVKAGDEYVITARYYPQAFHLVGFKEEYGPGTWPPQELEFPFTPIL